MNTTQIEMIAPVELTDSVQDCGVLVLRVLDSAEMIHVGGGYCAADY